MIKSSGVSGLAAGKNAKKIAFYQMMEGAGGGERFEEISPGTLHFIAWLEKLGHKVDYFILQHDLLEALQREKYDVVGISASELDFERVYHIAPAVKKINPNFVVAVGGYVAAGIGEVLVQHPAIDAVFEGEAEYTFPLFLMNLHSTSKQNLAVPAAEYYEFYPRQANGLPFETVYKSPISTRAANRIMHSSFARKVKGKEIKVPIKNVFLKDTKGRSYFAGENRLGAEDDATPIQGELDDLVNLPWWTAYSQYTPGIMQNRMYSTGKRVSWKDTRMYARRGCAGRCGFCSIHVKPRTPSPEAVAKTIERTITEFEHQTPKRRPLDIHFGDDSFTQSREWALELLSILKEKGLSARMGMSMQHRVVDAYHRGQLDIELLKALADNFFRQSIGVETLHPETAEYLDKTNDGKLYAARARELVLESLRLGIPTNLYAITVSPKSTLQSIAEDYLRWSKLARESYEQFGKVFSVSANKELIPHSQSRLTEEELNSKGIMIVARSAVTKIGRLDNIGGIFYPIFPSGEGFAGIFNPEHYIFREELLHFLEVLDKKTPRNFSRYVDYVKGVGETLLTLSQESQSKNLGLAAQGIIENMDFVIGDKLGKRIERIVEAEKVFNEAFYSSSFGICDYKTMRANLRKRFQGKPVKRIPIEEAIDKIAAKSQFYEQYRLTRNGGSPDSFFVQVMGEFYMLLARYAYNFDEDDTLPRLEKGRRALNGLVHESAFYRQKGGAPHRVYENIMLEYPEYAKRARELFKRGFPPMHPSDICFVDEKTGVMQFV